MAIYMAILGVRIGNGKSGIGYGNAGGVEDQAACAGITLPTRAMRLWPSTYTSLG